MFDFRRLRTDLLALGLLALAVFVGLSLVSFDPADPPSQLIHPTRAEPLNIGGELGANVAHALRTTFGLGAYLALFGLIAVDVRLFSRGENAAPVQRYSGWLLLTTAFCVTIHLIDPGLAGGQIVGSGGLLGAWGASFAEAKFAASGRLILVLSLVAAGIVLSTDRPFFHVAVRLLLAPISLLNRVAFGRARSAESETDENETSDGIEEPNVAPHRSRKRKRDRSAIEEAAEAGIEIADDAETRQPIRVNPPATAKSQREQVMERLEECSRQSLDDEYDLPSLDILEDAEDFPYELLAKKARVAAVTLEQTFQEFGLNVRVVEIDTGPVITQFELELEAGLRLSKVTALADDLAIALRVPSVRVVPSIPGKNTVGVEVPNEKQVMVRLRELIESCPNDIEKKRIPIFLGKDVSGRPMTVDMTKMPHLLIAGRTGTGKSVCLNSLILSILMTRTPEQVKMLMIDPKMVELSPYKRVPHLMHPVITDMKKAEAVLAWAVDKMEERYDLLARVGVRHLDGYNKLSREKVLERCAVDPDSPEADQIPEHMPYIVIIADEMADMMMTSGKDVEGHIIRLAQKSRAVGLHLVLATQKPTVDVITGLIKSNLPARISFQVASRTDSRVVLDERGADRLLGNGDMLYLAPGTSNLNRAQGTFVSDDEVNEIIEFFSDREPEYSEELAQISASASGAATDAEALKNRDELYEQAIEVVVREGRGSVSLLQRCLGIGYGRAARLVDYMAEDGIVGDYNGSQAREVLYTVEQWESLQAGDEPHLHEVDVEDELDNTEFDEEDEFEPAVA